MNFFLLTILYAIGLSTLSDQAESWAQESSNEPPNVLFLFVDDLNDWVLHPNNHPRAITPNMDRLREMSVNFTNAHATVPVCGPSRLTMLSGLYPEKVEFKWDWSKAPLLQDCVPIPLHFRDNGYGAYGIGKTFHRGADGDFWTDYGIKPDIGMGPDYGPYAWDGKSDAARFPHPQLMARWGWDPDAIEHMWALSYGPLADVPEYKPDPSKNIPGYKGWRYANRKPFYYKTDEDRDKMPDEIYAEWAVNMLKRKQDRPFFIGVGFVRPHVPLYAPSKYFDMYPLDEITLPPYQENDLDDVAQAQIDHYPMSFKMFQLLAQTKGKMALKEWVQAYLACITFVDDQIGKVLDALDASPHRDNTIVILVGDHGQHLGEKETIGKFYLWEESTRVPLFIYAPGFSGNGKSCDHPVSLIDIYPTLVDLCGLPDNPNQGKSNLALDGFSLRPFLENPRRSDWDGPSVALSAIYDHTAWVTNGKIIPHYSVRSRQYRYTLCANGEEELYDHNLDQNEWNNLAKTAEYAEVKEQLHRQLTAIVKPK